ncbi:eukaryotic translation elongation factor 1 epsilon-1 isoform X3 [Silurus meridionalis]|uniref:eukaryotic translation elongation factor 1 epsilon-1 isoform X3 n=1 Tax=Silurus meridionalis TaxID=175797 RepID=UPI001EE9FD6D|nr:eukaryotic translation elongation factor 1 epsilon-1 isoform X3 [Silurus meridionalis]
MITRAYENRQQCVINAVMLFGVYILSHFTCFSQPPHSKRFFPVPVLQNNNGSSLIGLVTISSHLELNEYLVDKVYLAGNSITLADALMYYGIHHIISELAVQQKEKYLNVTRWFDHIQHYPGVRHHLPPVIVLRNRVYQSNQH